MALSMISLELQDRQETRTGVGLEPQDTFQNMTCLFVENGYIRGSYSLTGQQEASAREKQIVAKVHFSDEK